MKRLLKGLIGLILFLAALPFLAVLFLQTEFGREFAGRTLGSLASSEDLTIETESLRVGWNGDVSLGSVTLSDRQGPWLNGRDIKVEWSPLSLLKGHVDVDRLHAGELSLIRKPAPSASVQDAAPHDGNGDSLNLVPVELRDLEIGSLRIGSAIVGEDLDFQVDGSASLADGPKRLAARIDLVQLEGAHGAPSEGTISANLLFAPAAQTLAFGLTAHEPRGGLLARLMEVPDLPALDLELTGHGPLSDWGADLAVALDGRRTVSGRAGLREANGGYLLTTDLDGALSPLMPGVASAFFLGNTKLTGTAELDANFLPHSGDFSLKTETLDATTTGSFEPSSGALSLDTTVEISAGADRLIALDLPERRLAFGPLNLRAKLTGNIDKAAIRIALDGKSVSTTEGRLGPLALSLVADDAVLDIDALAIPFQMALRVDDIEPVDDKLKPIGGDLNLKGGLTLSREGEGILLSGVRLTSPVVSMDVANGFISKDRITLAGSAGIGNLQAFSLLAGQSLSGAVAMTFDVKGDPDDRDAIVTLSANGRDLSFGNPDLDKLLTGAATLTTTVRVDDLEDIYVESAVLKAHGVEANGTAQYGEGALAAAVTGAFPDMTRLHADAAGALSFSANVKGPLGSPEITADLSSAQMILLGTALEKLAVTASGTASPTAPTGSLRGSATLGGAPVNLNANLSSADGGASIRDLSAVIGGNTLSGSFDIADLSDALATTSGKLVVDAPDLSTLSPLLLRPVAGSLEGSVLATTVNGPALQIDLKGNALAAEGIEVGDLIADIGVKGPFETPKLTADVLASRIASGETVIETAAVKAETEGNLTRFASDIRLTAGETADGVRAEGSLEQSGDQIAVTLNRLDGRYAGLQTDLKSPAVVTRKGELTRIESLVLNLGSGTLSVSGTASEELAISAEFSNVPLGLANAFAPSAALSGTLSGSAEVKGRPDAPLASWSVTMNSLSAGLLAQKGLPALDVASTGKLANELITQSTTITGPDGLKVTSDGKVGINRPQSLDMTVNGSLPLAFLRRPLTEAGLRAKGTVSVSGSVTGTAAEPQYALTAVPNGVTVTELSTSLTLTDVTGSVDVSPGSLQLSGLKANLASGGNVSAAGAISLNETLDADITINADQARYVDPGLVTALVSADVTVRGPLASQSSAALISGNVVIGKADISIPETLPGAVPPVAVTHVNTPARVREQLKELGAGNGSGGGQTTANLPPRLDIKVSAPGQIFVRGRGLDAELYGDLTIAGTTEAPQAVGAFTLKRGQMDILTRRLQFSKGQATFYGSLTPSLDFLATTSANSTSINVTVEGQADDPLIAFSSSPELPQDEVLALLLFGKDMGSLSPAQVAQLAAAIATLTGGDDNGPLAQIRKSLGLDAIDINTSGDDGPTVGVGKYVNDNIYLGVEQGTGEAGSRVKVDIDLDRGLKVRGEVGADGSSKAGIFFEKEY
ncbi:translocation/assembly module TamB domain-containing protein [Roseibium sp.]|uniref:translocation/assembly module TamB domain-containing protein n=1 Tax=Roseibium sp. TaxID=1936156 RepID=UPI003A96E971